MRTRQSFFVQGGTQKTSRSVLDIAASKSQLTPIPNISQSDKTILLTILIPFIPIRSNSHYARCYTVAIQRQKSLHEKIREGLKTLVAHRGIEPQTY